MSDSSTTLQMLRERVRKFVSQRDWETFHAPKNITMALAIEAAELMEHFQWLTVGESRQVRDLADERQAVADEMADVLCYLLALSNEMEIDLSEAFTRKMVLNEQKYPVERFRGRFGEGDRGQYGSDRES